MTTPQQPAPASNDDLVTVAIPARNESATIGALLESVLSQTHSNLQVLVVDGGLTSTF